jgi:hypothetical protein
MLAVMLAMLGACATVPSDYDGAAVECDACQAMWIRLDRPRGLAGLYTIRHRPDRELCAECNRMVRRCLRGGPCPETCEACQGNLTSGVVELTDKES